MASTHLEIQQEDGSYLKFTKERIRARWVKEVFKMEREVAALGKKGDFATALDVRVKFVVALFNDSRLTEDIIYDGIDSENIIEILDRITHDIVGQSGDKGAGASDPGKS